MSNRCTASSRSSARNCWTSEPTVHSAPAQFSNLRIKFGISEYSIMLRIAVFFKSNPYLKVGLSTVLSSWATRSPNPSLTASKHQSLPWWSGGSSICANRRCTAGFMYFTGCFDPGTQFSINGSPQLTISHTVSCRSFEGFSRVASSRPLSIKADMTVAGAQEWTPCTCID